MKLLAPIAFLAWLCAACASAAVPPYPAATTPLSGAEELICWQGGVTKDCTVSNIVGVPPSIPATGQWYSNLGAKIVKLNDRVFINAATVNSGDNPLTTYDWLSLFQNSVGEGSSVDSAALAVLTQGNANAAISGGVFGGQTQYAGVGGASEPLSSYIINNTSTSGEGWGFYTEAWDTTAAAAATCCTFGAELEAVTTINGMGFSEPYAKGTLAPLLLGCGGGLSSPTRYPCPSALEIVANTQPFLTGINFNNGALAAGAIAIAVPENTIEMRQWTHTGNIGSSIISDVTTYTDGTGFVFDNVGFHIRNTTTPQDIAVFVPTGGFYMNGATGGSEGDGTINATSYYVSGAAPTGSGAVVEKTSPSLTTPNIGAASATSVVATAQLTAGTFLRPGQTLYAGLATADPSPQVGDQLDISDASACTANTQVSAGGGSTHSCAVVYNGVGWLALVTH